MTRSAGLLMLLSLSAPAWQAQTVLKDATVYSRPALLLSNDKLELAILKQGGSIIRVLLHDDAGKINPFGNPEMFPNVPEQRKLQGPQVGHFVCVDGFGPASAEERKAGMPMHGEAHQRPWEVVSSAKEGATTTVRFRVELPLVHETLFRTLQLVDGEQVVYVDSELESHLSFDRQVAWGEHPYVFSPFLEAENTVMDMSGTWSKTRQYAEGRGSERRAFASNQDFNWPMAPSRTGGLIDMRYAKKGADEAGHTTTLMDPARRIAFVTFLNTSRHLLLGYLFRREEFPYLETYWNYSPDGWLARSAEFTTQPFDMPRPQAAETRTMFNMPVSRWLPAKAKITSRFLMFYVTTPDGMTKVDDVRLEGGKLVVEDRTAGKRIVLAASQTL
ncbi:MAG TPA: hypothetical protein VLH09_14400 [Bryobacteraceae bacterium]|nr:hypothetical protein [Bryobacteraceae bacterium]